MSEIIQKLENHPAISCGMLGDAPGAILTIDAPGHTYVYTFSDAEEADNDDNYIETSVLIDMGLEWMLDDDVREYGLEIHKDDFLAEILNYMEDLQLGSEDDRKANETDALMTVLSDVHFLSKEEVLELVEDAFMDAESGIVGDDSRPTVMSKS